MKPFVKPLIIAVVILGLGGVALWDDKQTAKETKEKDAKTKLLSIKPDAVVKLEYTKADAGKNVHVQMAKEGDKWKILAPLEFPGDGEGVNRLLKTFEDLRFEKSFEATPEKVKEFGLDQPKIVLDMTDKDGRSTKVQIGAKSPVGFSSYVKIDASNTVYLVNHIIFTASNKELFDFRDKGLRWPNLDEVKAIGYQYENEPIITLKRIDKDWVIESPKKFKADGVGVKQFLTWFQSQRIAKFMDDPSPAVKEAVVGKRSGSRRIATLVLTSPNDKLTQYAILENGDDLYTTMEGYDGLVVLDRKLKEGLKKTVADFQERGMFTYNSTEATEVDFNGKVYVKKGDQWEVKDGGEKADFVKLALVDFEFAKADLVLTKDEAANFMKGAPLHTAKVSFKDGKAVEFSLWKIEGDPEHVAIKVNPDAYYKASKQYLENFNPKPKLSEKDDPHDHG